MTKNTIGCLIPRRTDCCPDCKQKLKVDGIKVLYKDFVECNHCGYMWITRNLDLIEQYS